MNSSLDFSTNHVLVVGDLMLDQYHFGNVDRISPEAPVPIVKVTESHCTLGGAGNVANNINHLGGNVLLVGLVGKDNNKLILEGLLEKKNINSALIETDLPTITKVRVIGEHQQILRLDFEEPLKFSPQYEGKLISHCAEFVDRAEVIVISDYGKGVCSLDVCEYLIKAGKERGKFVIIDPKGHDWHKYKHATLVKPNLKELSYVVGFPVSNNDNEIEQYGMEVLNKYEITYLLVTRSEKGMTLISNDNVSHFKTEAKEVFDVSGAGDTVIGTISVALATGMTLNRAVNLANKAAGIVVGKIGTVPIYYCDLLLTQHQGNGKCIDSRHIQALIAKLRNDKREIVFTNGCFDILHRGHIDYLRKAKDYGDVLIVGLNSDVSVKKIKGAGRPFNTQFDRAEMLSVLEFVDYIIIFNEDTPYTLIRMIMPDVLAKGGDYVEDEVVGREFAGETVIIPLSPGYSTTGIVNQIQQHPIS